MFVVFIPNMIGITSFAKWPGRKHRPGGFQAVKRIKKTTLMLMALIATTSQGAGNSLAAENYTIERVGPDKRVEITATSVYWLGHALATAHADDYFCGFAQSMVIAAGQQAKYIEPTDGNIAAGLYAKAAAPERARLKTPAQDGPNSHPDEVAYLNGYVDGFNAYAGNFDKLQSRHPQCADAPIASFRLTVEDLLHAHPALNCSSGYWREVVQATPPVSASTRKNEPIASQKRGSATWAFGGAITRGGGSILLVQPHDEAAPQFAVRLRVPGQLDIFASSYAGIPGFHSWTNGRVASGQTCQYGQAYAAYRLNLSEKDPLSYVIDGVVKPLEKRTVSIELRAANGVTKQRDHVFYRSEFGFIVGGEEFPWTLETAYALRAVNESIPDYFIYPLHPRINSARTVEELAEAYISLERNDHLQLAFIDDDGRAASLSNGVVINLPDAQWADCAVFEERGAPVQPFPLPILDGSRSECALKTGQGSKTSGIVARNDVPIHFTEQALMHSNQSASLANPAEQMLGYPRFVDREGNQAGVLQNGSARYLAHGRILRSRANGSDGYPGKHWSVETAWQRLVDGESHWAMILKTDVVELCFDRKRGLVGGLHIDLTPACGVLSRWDGKSRAESRGYLLWSAFWSELPKKRDTSGRETYLRDIFIDSYDPRRPYDTLGQLDDNKSEVIVNALARAVWRFVDSGTPLDLSVAEGQRIVIDGKTFALPGCIADDACENVQSGPQNDHPTRLYVRGDDWVRGVSGFRGGGTTIVYGLAGNGKVTVKYGGPLWAGDAHPLSGVRTLGAERWAKGEGFVFDLEFSDHAIGN